jgi:3-dehydroquinate dehydratase I
MTTHRTVKGSRRNSLRRAGPTPQNRGRLVGVVASQADLRAAVRMRRPPDLFEIRLDCFSDSLDEIAAKLPMLRAPLIITARHPREGGVNNLSTADRRRLLARFLSAARFIDIELRSVAALGTVIQLARRKKIQPIISFHDLKSTPTVRTLRAKAQRAKKYGATVFKVATRTDTPAQLKRLIDFFEHTGVDIAVSAMGMGRLGATSRLLLARAGSALHYGSLGRPLIEGQLSIEQLRSTRSASKFKTEQRRKRERSGQRFA